MEDKGEYFSLKWRNFRSSLTEGFQDFLQEEAMVDVTLAAEGKFVQAHKLVLSVCSPYFKNLFRVNPCKHPIVFLKDVGLNDLSYMLEFMYKGEVGVKHEDLQSFLKLAETLKVKGLAGEKIQNTENCSSNNLDSNIARVRKKVNKDVTFDVNKENSEFHSYGEQSDEKIIRSKRRVSSKSKPVKKIKGEKCDNDSVNKCEEKNSDNVSEDEDNNPLIKFIGGDSVKSGDSSKESIPQCDNENESQCDNKTAFSVWSDDVPGSNDSGGPDMNSLFQTDYSEEAEQAPQDVFLIQTTLRFSPVWNYYDKVQNNMAVCRVCRKILKGAQTSQAEYHLRAKHPQEAATFIKQKAEWLEKKKKMNAIFVPGVGHLSSLVISRAPRAFVWDYFLKETHQAICLNCGKTFKGQRPNTICEQHLKRRHPEFYKILLEKKIKRAELHMNPMIMGLGIPSYEHD